ncbi:hypothetical protein MINS_12480 [Mycolicibacterium insubricum]|uniref:Uncharacterized protein n=1 Tax=Mycolicibacterium insubricum TaxID=444597 RepID=A0A1X0CSM8_9MYCO|nr:hypothetical protein [Mycolicibacterium insubricum]MCV7080274.1 hypothetical protein [Mycolicibacterium insubricum]ORA63191.1 hypothetical protein BST26_20555 [Mycolicibacterium insubricum]BBZ65819.1 hypothetical protein MINS_12480 [Mycolicibacterium insubricum]
MAHTISKNTGVLVPKATGGIFRYPLGTILPTDPWTPRPVIAGWDPRLGGVSDEGATSNTKRDSEKKKDWNGDKVRGIQTGKDDTLKLTYIEPLNPRTMEEYFGKANVEVTPATTEHGTLIAARSNSDVLPHYSYIIDVFDGAVRKRRCLPDAQVAEIGDEVWKSTDWAAYPLTYDLFPDLAGNTFYDYTELDDKLVVTNFVATLGGNPTGGDWELHIGADHATIGYNIASTAFKTALEALPSIGAGNATVTGSAGGPYTIAITTAGAPAISADAAGLTPSGTVTITQA